MRRLTPARLLAAALAGACLAAPAAATTLVVGGGPRRTDCYAEWRLAGNDTFPVPRPPGYVVTCPDGNPTCDVDGQRDGRCTLDVSICVLQSNVPWCTPETAVAVRKIIVRRSEATRDAGIPRPRGPHLAAASPACGPGTRMVLPLLTSLDGTRRASKRFLLKMEATTAAILPVSGRPVRDRDLLRLRCVPSPGDCHDSPNPDGGPSTLTLSAPPDGAGTDLDIGWNGISHNFPFGGGAVLTFCLTGCDGSTRTTCTGTAPTGSNTENGTTFGPPLPLLTAGTPVCLVSRFAGNPTVTTDLTTGAIEAGIDLLQDVYITRNVAQNGRRQVCPQCSGDAIGDLGVCIGGRNDGLGCRVDGTALVADSTGDQIYRLSALCRPSGPPLATLALKLAPLGTGTASLTGPRPCPGQLQEDACGSGTCDAPCTGDACVSTVPDPVDPLRTVCVARLGGLSQLCCSTDTTRPCHPTRNGGMLVRRGRAEAPAPDASGVPLPASAHAVLGSVFCVPGSFTNLDDNFMGAPGASALLLPVTARWAP